MDSFHSDLGHPAMDAAVRALLLPRISGSEQVPFLAQYRLSFRHKAPGGCHGGMMAVGL